MANRCFSRIVLSVVIILLALEYSSAECDQGNLGKESQKDVLLQSDTRFVLGRKMLRELDGKPVYMAGRGKSADLDKSFPQVQLENNHQKQQQQQQKQKHSEKSILKRDNSMNDDESKAFLEAADEVANLMRKDYRVAARRKPPINNHEPKD